MMRFITLPLFIVLGLVLGVAMFFLTMAMALEAGWRL
jgi:hypothetical protein